MKNFKYPIHLRAARAGDRLDAHGRAMLVNDARRIRAVIEDVFATADHWNNSHPAAKPIDPDPDGQMRQLAEELDALLLREQPRPM